MIDASLSALKALAMQFPADPRQAISVRRLASAAAFSSRRIDVFADVCPKRPLIAVVVEGRKDVLFQGKRTVLGPGDVLVAPPGVAYHATTTPDRSSKHYRVFCTEVDAEAAAGFARAHPELSATVALGAFELTAPHVVPASTLTLQALLHFAQTLLAGDVEPALVRHRLLDLLLSLSLQHARKRAAVPSTDPVLAARVLMRRAPEEAWPVTVVARKLAMSPATLRRRLAASGASLKTIRAEERMSLAAVLLAQPGARVGEVAARCGYASASKFAVQYRRWFGRAPGARVR